MIIHGPINNLGYGQVTSSICYELENYSAANLLKKDFLLPINNSIYLDDSDYRISNIKKMLNTDRFNRMDTCLKIWHEFDLYTYPGKGKLIGLPFFEICTLDDRRIQSIKSTDLIVLPTKWAQKVVDYTTNNHPSVVVNMGVDRTIFYEAALKTHKDKFIFFNCGKWEIRKGHDLLIEAFIRGFKNNPKAELWLMCDNPFLSPSDMNYWKNLYANVSNIKILPRVATQMEVAHIMRSVDCGVFPSRAEGWNMELLEMMSCGKPVIASNYSAHTEYCTAENSLLLSVKDLVPAIDGKWFHGESLWAELDVEELIDLMLAQFKRGPQLNNAGIETAKKLSWWSCVQKLKELA